MECACALVRRRVTVATEGDMATVSELRAVLTDTLDKRGVLGQLKARVRAEVFAALNDQSEPRPELSHENLLINEMIREYLEFNKYKHTSSVLSAESGLSDVPLDRSFLARELNLIEDTKAQSVPILYGLLAHFLHAHREMPCPSALRESSKRQAPTEYSANRIAKGAHLEPTDMMQPRTAESYVPQGAHR
ncbi:centrosomal protein 20 isoform X1 [Dendrobates tinctorius]|uniref:centrosomal protein 20 isoform X1 n=2 Tax=Dendrobates tinctorius TaxID=92724 RepID=UPI003CC98B38